VRKSDGILKGEGKMGKPLCKMTIKDLLDEMHQREELEGETRVQPGWVDWPKIRDIGDLLEASLLDGDYQEEDWECSTFILQGIPYVKQVNTLM
jgi:hypothetical protein